MGDLIGHWNTIAEAQKLGLPQLIPGVVEENIKRENPILRSPVALAKGTSIKWNREKTDLSGDVQKVAVGATRVWTADVEYDQKESFLTVMSISRLLNKFIPEVYGTINNYEAQVLIECKKAMLEALGDQFVYGDYTYGTNEFDGMHAWAAEQSSETNDLDIDGGEAANSLQNVRKMLIEMRRGADCIFAPVEMRKWVDAMYQEKGFAGLKGDTAGTMARIQWGINEVGQMVPFFDGVPLVYTDYLVAEQANTGRGSNKRAKYTSGTKQYSLIAVKWGDIFNEGTRHGLCLAFGNESQRASFYETEYFDKLENFVGTKGLGLLTYAGCLLGSKYSVARIHDITDAAWTV